MKKGIIAMLAVALTFNLYGQIDVDVKGKVKDKVNDRANQRTDDGIDAGLDAVEQGVKSLFKKKERNTQAEERVERQTGERSDMTAESKDEPKQSTSKPSEKIAPFSSYTKYDFVPGDQVLLFDDFSQDAVGDFPALWTTNGSGEVRTTNLYQGNWFYMGAEDAVYTLMKNLALPANYILEFDVIPTNQEEGYGNCGFSMTLYQSDEEEFLNDALYPGTAGVHFHINSSQWEARAYTDSNYDIDGSSQLAPIEENKVNHVIIWVQNRRVRIYSKGQKIMDMPTLLHATANKFNRLRYSLWGQDGFPYVSNLRFTTAAPDMRSKLLTDGKIVSYGIYFDTNSDKVKPESYGTLKQIADVLKENPDVRVKIVGHTDSDGDEAKNLDLSRRRAASVKNELANTFSIAENRIETDGKGETEPVQDNNTAEGKAKNRRVEFIKL